jgi:outer membrane biosynthesis protein TonB
LDNQGTGEIQPKTPVSSDVSATQSREKTEQTEEINKTQDQPLEEVKEDKEETPVVSKEDSPVVVKEEKKKPTESVTPKEKESPKKDETGAKEKTKDTAPTKVQQKDDVKKTGDNTQSHGDDAGKTGDKGNPQGSLDAKALYGKQGGGNDGNGLSLSMSGWRWADQPKIPELPDNEDGRIVFEIECDADGEIVGITTLERGLSPRAEQLLKEEIRRNSLERTSDGKVPERSKGKVVFLLKTK